MAGNGLAISENLTSKPWLPSNIDQYRALLENMSLAPIQLRLTQIVRVFFIQKHLGASPPSGLEAMSRRKKIPLDLQNSPEKMKICERPEVVLLNNLKAHPSDTVDLGNFQTCHGSMEDLQDPKMGWYVSTIFSAIFGWDILCIGIT